MKSNPVERFCEKLVASLSDGTFVRLNLSGSKTPGAPEKIFGRLVRIRGEVQLSLTLRWPTRDETQNLRMDSVTRWLKEQLGKCFRNALLGTTTRDWQLMHNKSGEAQLVSHKPVTEKLPPQQHDNKHNGLLNESASDWLSGLGIFDQHGKPRALMADKLRQINHYLEILSHLARECDWLNHDRPVKPLHFVDMGCGKGYLTFGLWHLLNRVLKIPARVSGIEARPELVATTNKLAREIGADELQFLSGTIADAPVDQFDALIALHACDTATDDAIKRGIATGAKLIVVAPCCQKELRPQLGTPEPLAPILEHGIMAERLAEWATDGLRAMYLDWAGYRARLQEFVSSEHTPKNLMLAAIRTHAPFSNQTKRTEIVALKQFLGVTRHTLDPLLENNL